MPTNNDTVINPLEGPLIGSTRVPGDKSISHRAILFSAMAEGTSRVQGVLDSDDVRSSIAAVRALGADVSLERALDGSLQGGITGWGAEGPRQPQDPIDCGNSGTTVRLLMGVLAPWDISVTLTGDDSLVTRPMRRVTFPLMKMGVRFMPEERATLPLTERGTAKLRPIEYDTPVASAQLKTAILLAGLFAEGVTTVNEPAPSRNHTELMLPQYGAQTMVSERSASVRGPVRLHACEIAVPGDPSSAAFIACAAALKPGSRVQIENVSVNPARIGFVRMLENMGADISVSGTGSSGKERFGTISILFNDHLTGTEVPGRKIAGLVDEIPVLSLVAARAHGITVFRDAGELRVKESDRMQAIIDGLAQIGVNAWNEADDLFIEGNPDLSVPAGLTFDSHGDHRLAMTWAVLGMTADVPVAIKGFEAVTVSFPTFLTQFERLVH
ncbi:MAG: 3-phosphoshikimate 1-carboxyvinyltransferase [Eggerthellaceae bacterium]|jgi:3-phosphoshikimate 1-carboxyvinyltransferase